MVTETESRENPYQLVFGAESIDDRLFPPIAEEAEARGQPLDDPDRFLFLSSVGKLLQAIGGAEDAGYETEDETTAGQAGEAVADAEDTDAGDGEALRQYGRLLYHAFHYWQNRKVTRRVDEASLRWLLDDVTSVGDWTLRPPSSSGYLQLPRNLVWAEPAPGLTPEPADGFFWTYVEPEDEPAALHVLLVLGVRADRPGFSVVPATGVLDTEPHWAELEAREDGPDFGTTLPGGEMDELYSVTNAAELLKLASLCFWSLSPGV
ncbi:MAG: hypothetical protein ACOC5I_02460 [Gemmatimonadota bacterium]